MEPMRATDTTAPASIGNRVHAHRIRARTTLRMAAIAVGRAVNRALAT